ncbi:ShKT domain-containing protein [Strongyloides ratti]|uniref:ShKT domain-containing protein n=1 Tax=Strongyloides ratti TaxID=34506 RepID=A0A090LGB0_STRRB|nr:ShKT domain-containing protein [Strongyloides ratti]CEF68836.1 ShKT domain-containing protein [Strongyloides ratti]
MKEQCPRTCGVCTSSGTSNNVIIITLGNKNPISKGTCGNMNCPRYYICVENKCVLKSQPPRRATLKPVAKTTTKSKCINLSIICSKVSPNQCNTKKLINIYAIKCPKTCGVCKI